MENIFIAREMNEEEKKKIDYKNYEFLGMIYKNGWENHNEPQQDEMRKFYYVLAKDSEVILHCFATTVNGFYKKNGKIVAPMVEIDVVETDKFKNLMEFMDGMEASNHIYNQYDTAELVGNFKRIYGEHELDLRCGTIEVIKSINGSLATNQNEISKEYYLDNKLTILEQLGCRVLDDNALILDVADNYYGMFLEKLIEYHTELIRSYLSIS